MATVELGVVGSVTITIDVVIDMGKVVVTLASVVSTLSEVFETLGVEELVLAADVDIEASVAETLPAPALVPVVLAADTTAALELRSELCSFVKV